MSCEIATRSKLARAERAAAPSDRPCGVAPSHAARRTAGGDVDADGPLMEAGSDSRGAVELRNTLQQAAGDVVALPSFLFACSRIISGYVGGLPGVHAMWAGADWTWHNWVHRNDEITTEAWLKDLIEHDTQFSGRAVQQIYQVNFYNQEGDLISEADSWCFRTDRDFAREEGS